MVKRFFPTFVAVLCAAVALLLGACGLISIGYSNAPTLLTLRADQYFNLDGEQEARFKERMQALHAWHRRQVLPGLIGALDEADRRLARPLAPGDADWLVEQAQTQYRIAAGRIAYDTADIAATLKPGQLAYLKRHMDEKNQEFAQKWVDAAAEDVREERFERIESNVEDWLGRLDARQRDWLHARLDAIPVDYRAWLEERQRRDAELLALLRIASEGGMRPAGFRSGSMTADALQRWAQDWDNGRSTDVAEQSERLLRDYKQLYVELVNQSTQAQRAHLRQRLRGYADQLAREAEPPLTRVRRAS